jgi:BlaI family transcriptional regulator, penicillinase repressor
VRGDRGGDVPDAIELSKRCSTHSPPLDTLPSPILLCLTNIIGDHLRPTLTRRELDVMSVIWTLGSATVADVKAGLSDDLAYPTVLTILRTLEAKGHVRHTTDGKAFRYFARTKSADAGSSALARVLDKVYRGSRELLVAGLLSDNDVDAAELKRLRALVDERLREIDS